MGCLSMTITPLPQATLAIRAGEPARLDVSGMTPAVVEVSPRPQAELTVRPMVTAAVEVVAKPQVALVIGEVCSVSSGELFVLAASDGPLRTSDGGYLLLDPAGEQD